MYEKAIFLWHYQNLVSATHEEYKKVAQEQQEIQRLHLFPFCVVIVSYKRTKPRFKRKLRG